MDLIYLLDVSQLTNEETLESIKNYIKKDLDSYNFSTGDNVRMEIVLFDDSVRSVVKLDQDITKDDYVNKINSITLKEKKNADFTKAFSYILSNVQDRFRKDAAKVLVLITTSNNKNSDPSKMLSDIAKLKQDGVKIVTVGLGKRVDTDELNNIATEPNYVVLIDDSSKLDENVSSIKRAVSKSTGRSLFRLFYFIFVLQITLC